MHFRRYLARPETGFDLLRIYLGIGLFVRGCLIARDPAMIEQFLGAADWFIPMFTAHAIVLSHLVGGLLLALGYCTRFAAAVQIPTVAGALFLVHWHEGLFSHTQSTELAALVLVALVLFATFGAGQLSIDRQAERLRLRTAGRVPPLVPQFVEEPRELMQRARALREEPAPTEGQSLDLALTPDTPRARALYRDAKFELMLLIAVVCVLFVLLANAFYVAATAWFIASLIVFGIWRIGKAEFH